MPIGTTYPSEKKTIIDPVSKREIIKLTDNKFFNTPMYFTNCSWGADHRMVYLSTRTGQPNLFAMDEEGTSIQLTDGKNILWYTAGISRNGKKVYYIRANEVIPRKLKVPPQLAFLGKQGLQSEVRAVDLETLEDRLVLKFPPGYNGGSPLLENADGTQLGLVLRKDDLFYLVQVNIEHGTIDIILETETYLGHPQFSPTDPKLIMYCHDDEVKWDEIEQRMWLINTDGSNNRPLYDQQPKDWITHEMWAGTGKEVSFINWPNSLMAINHESGKTRVVAEHSFWHCGFSPDGKWGAADTQEGEVYLVSFETGEKTLLADVGWDEAVPVLHPHPSFSPDQKQVIFAVPSLKNCNVCLADTEI